MSTIFKLIRISLFSAFLSCSTQHVLLNTNALFKNQSVTIKTDNGENISGVVCLADSHAVIILDRSGQQTGVLLSNIVSATGPHPVFDNTGELVSEAEIDSFRTDTNLKIYTIIGGIFSGGLGFLSGRLTSQTIGKSKNHLPDYLGTTAGLTLGGVLFAATGIRKDRELAIEQVLLSRDTSDYSISLPDREDDILLRKKIDQVIEERRHMEKEIEQLLDELNNMNEPTEAANQRDKSDNKK